MPPEKAAAAKNAEPDQMLSNQELCKAAKVCTDLE